MKKKINIFSLAFLVGSIFLFCISMFTNKRYFNLISNENIVLYQLKQAISVMVLYLMGYIFLKLIQINIENKWANLLAFPCGIAIWVFASMSLLMTNITYYDYRVYILIIVFLVVAFIIRIAKKVTYTDKNIPSISSVFIVIGSCLLVSTGWNYVIMNYDSYLYFADYGKTLTILQEWKAFNTGNAYVLTNIGQFLPLVNSYAAFWGYDYCLPIQTFLIANTVVLFAVAIYDYGITKLEKRQAKQYTILFVLLVITSTPLLIYSNWLLSNAFLMVYLFVAIVVADKLKEKISLDYILILLGACLAMTFLRKDGIIIVCFMIICFKCKDLATRRQLLVVFLPSALLQLYYVYFMRFVIGAWTRTAVGTSILNNKSIVLIIVAISVTIIYILWGEELVRKLIHGNKYKFFLFVMIVATVGAIAIKPIKSIDHIDAILRVVMGSSYGFSVFIWSILICVVFLTRPKLGYEGFLIVGYCLLTFLIYWNKGNTEQGIDNSGMRMFYQIIPIFFFFTGKKYIDLLEGIYGKKS